MKYRLGTSEDLDNICALIASAVAHMEEQGIYQWDEIYPAREDFELDIAAGNLYVAEESNRMGENPEQMSGNLTNSTEDPEQMPKNMSKSTDGADRTNGSKLAAIYVISEESDEAYDACIWQDEKAGACVIHRLCVNPEFQHRGTGRKVLTHIESQLSRMGYHSVRLDVFTQNPHALALYRRHGYEERGFADWRKGRFLLMEKHLPSFEERFELCGIQPEDAAELAEVEAICFPPSEACTYPIMRERAALATDCFLAAKDRKTGRIIGFVNGLCTDEDTLKDEIFTDTSLHDPRGRNMMICGVDVLPDYRGQWIAEAMMKEFLARQKAMGREKAILTCVPGKVSMYEKFGYTDLGDSESEWGGEKWHEMVCVLKEAGE